ncbi:MULTISPECIES: TonB-dependent receptor [unclassified Spirosoma]|uniref:SusC/RagA family TonB-linked outer membrane protein n=1 Tax=unclassified Spirosoma TaxID=2621999 RepID=UPI0009624DC8|nr:MULTISPECIES: TonB-dependent receptor [unclassified Spirosoma]MBN8821377.1 TonB-dependent receptor [Spirosoma sp.]OJW78164.1 MAG: SusC/RagA family TonB-linked outer membrane protein [Spirosoma sp. 48-14]
MKKLLLTSWLLTIVFCLPVFAQDVTVSGRVTSSEDGAGLPGVSVQLKGTSRGTTTDAEGKYRINAPASGRLVFSFIGFASKEMAIGNQSTISVDLTPDAANLDEVIVTTFGTAKKAAFTGSAGVIDQNKIQNRVATNIGQVLSGAIAGVQTTAGSGQPGTAPDIRIRGFGSISSGNDPLYVVDGVPYSGSIANISPGDIESISVLKDAASTALYGSRAANGVVVVTTKKGQKDRSIVNVRYTKGFSTRGLPEYDRVGVGEYYPLMWEMYRNSVAYRATNPVALATANADATSRLISLVGYNVYNVPDNQVVDVNGQMNPTATLKFSPDDLNWEKPIMRQGNRDEITVGLSGGQNKTDYYVSFSYLNDKGYLIRSDYDRFTGRLNVNSQMKPWLRTGANISTTITKSNQADAGSSTAFVNPFYFSRNMGPIYPVYAYDPANPGQFLLLPNGDRRWDYGNLTALGLPARPQFGGRHSVAETLLNQNYFRRNVLGARGFAEVSFLKDFKFSVNIGTDITNYNGYTFGNPEVGDGAPAGRASHEFQNIASYNLNQLLNYNKGFGKHNVEVLVGHENFQVNDNNLAGSRSQLILEGNYELVNFTTTTNLSSVFNTRRVEGYFSRVNYDYDQKYFLSGSVRRDGSSKFYTDSRWGTFYSVSGAWRLDQEEFVRSIPSINLLKLRSSYGQTGNDGGGNTADGASISYYAWQPLYGLGWNNASEAGILQTSLGNRNLAWESSNSFDVGLEFSLFKGRVSGTVEYFNRQSSNLIFDVPLPLSSGISTVTRNIGTMYNRGIEVELGLEPVRTKDFTWRLDLNATTLKNRITKMPDENPEIIDGTKKLAVGRSIYDYWLREYAGVNSANGEAQYRAANYVAANTRITEQGDTLTNSVNNARYRYNGSSIPALMGGFTNTFKYKGLSLSALVVYQIGGKTYDAAYSALMSVGGYGSAKHVDILKRWRNPGDVTDVPRMDAGRTSDFDAASDRWLIDASYLNLRSVTLSYALPTTLARKVFLENAQVYLSAENFLILSNRKGMNVQQTFTGVTSNVFSPAKSVVLGVSFTL